MEFRLYLILFTSLCFLTCQSDNTNKSINNLKHATAEDFAEANQVVATVADGLDLDLWAPGPLLSNAVALSFDKHGVAYVTETQRRKSSDHEASNIN